MSPEGLWGRCLTGLSLAKPSESPKLAGACGALSQVVVDFAILTLCAEVRVWLL